MYFVPIETEQISKFVTMNAKHCLFLLLTLALILEESIGGAHFVLLVILGWLIVRPPREVFGVAFLVGLGLDLFSNAPFGTHSAIFLLFSFLTSLVFKKAALVNGSVLILPLVFFFSGLYQSFVDLFWLGKVIFAFNLNQAILNTILMIPIIKILFWLKERVIVEESIQLKFGL